jgi:hypothetical protein
MIGTIRKHSKWLWAVIITLTVISFIYWGAAPSGVNRGGVAGGDFGSINGKKITQQEYVEALNGFKLLYLFQRGTWPEKNASLTQKEIDQQVYERLLLMQKAADLGIHVGLDSAALAANQMLLSLSRKGQTISVDQFVKQVLEPESLTAADFENYARQTVVIQQLIQSIGSSGALITPQEAAGLYQREHQELASQIVFFSAQKYLSSVQVTPEALGEFYTNYLAEYRLPDRVQLNYVCFNITNYLAQSKADWAKTNFEQQVEAIYNQYGAQAFPDAKTPEAAKEKVRDTLIRSKALGAASKDANDFANAVFKMDPARAENLAAVAKEKGLVVQTTAPFAAETGPQEFAVPKDFAKTVSSLTPDEPFASPVAAADGIYVIALARQLPSEIPAFADIRAQVKQDFQMQQAIALAREAGTNFFVKLTVGMAAGKSFAAVCAADGLQPQTLPPFSLSTRELPALGDRAELDQVKQAAFTTTVGRASSFQETSDGGFVLFVQSQLPIDQAVMAADLPQYTESLRRTRENEAFNEWLQAEAGRALRDTPVARQ